MLIMKDQIKTVHNTRQVTVDSETGEVLDVQEIKVDIVVNDDKFALVYASLWDLITESNLSKSDIEMLGYLIKNYDRGVPFTITTAIKNELAQKSKKSPTSYNKSAKSLVDAGFIYKFESERTYKLNPKYAFEGSSKDRKNAIINMRNYITKK